MTLCRFGKNILLLIVVAWLCPSGAEGALQCYECHGTMQTSDYRPVDASSRTASSGGFKGNHRTHMGTGATPAACDACHASGSSMPSTYTSGHSNGMIETAGNINMSPHPGTATYKKNGIIASSFPQTSAPNLGSCDNVNCHFESVTLVWGSSSLTSPDDCGVCHGNPPATGNHPVAGSKHAAYHCSHCHPGHTSFGHATSAGHPDRRIHVQLTRSPNVSGSYAGQSGSFLPSQSSGRVYGACASLYCHSSGSSLEPPGAPRMEPVWGSTLDCNGCHGAGTATLATGSHPAHLRSASCDKCHSATAASATAIGNPAAHANRSVEIAFSFNNSTTGMAHYAGQPVPIAKTPGSPGGTCTSIYCHSDGTAVSSRVISQWKKAALDVRAVNQGPGESLAWGAAGSGSAGCAQSDGRHCSACHYYPPSWGSFHGFPLRADCSTCHTDIQFGNTTSFVTPYPLKCTQCHDYPPKYPTKGSGYGPKANVHDGSHAYPFYMCSDCHFDTTADGMTIKDPSKHGNGIYDIKNGPNVPAFTYTYDKEGGTCTTACHSARSWSGNVSGGVSGWQPYIESSFAGCQTYSFTLNVPNKTPYTYALPLRNIVWDFGDGVRTDPAQGVNGTAAPVTHRFDQPGTYTVSVSATDQNGITVSGRTSVNITGYYSGNKYATANFDFAATGNTVTVTDLSTDSDSGACAPSLGGKITVDWGDGTVSEEPVMLSPTPSGRTLTHTYSAPGQYCVSHLASDNSGSGTQASRGILKVQIPPESPDSPLAQPVVAGVVKSYDGTPLEGAQITLFSTCYKSTAKVVATATTAADGAYRFTGPNWYDSQYCVEAVKDGYTFANMAAVNMTPCRYDIEHLNLTASTPSADPGSPQAGKMTISGRVADATGTGVSAPIWLLVNGRTYYSQGYVWPTSSNTSLPASEVGKFTIADLPEDCYLVKMPSYSSDSGRWEFDPPEQEVCQSSPAVNFTARKVPIINSISGTVYDSSTNKPVGYPSVRLSLKDQEGNVVRTTTTGANGYYRFSYSPFEVPEGYSWTFWGFSTYNVPAGTYTIQAEQEGYDFASIQVTGKAGDVIWSGANIYGTPTMPRMTMAGKLIDQSSGIMTSYNRPAVRIKKGTEILEYPTVAADGSWQSQSFLKGCYTVDLTTSNPRLTFTPASREICDTDSALDFTVLPNPDYPAASDTIKLIAGTVRSADGSTVAGVEVRLKGTDGTVLKSVWTTGEASNFSLGNLPADGCYMLEPVRPGFSFSPPSITYCVPRTIRDMAFLATDNRGQMFRGRIRNQDGAGADGVTVRLKDEITGSVLKTAVSITGGWYSFGKISTGCYLIEPEAGAPIAPLSSRICGGGEADFIFTNPFPEAGTVATPSGIHQVDLTWADTFADESGFVVERCSGDGCSDFTVIGEAGPEVTRYTDTTACVGSYTYRIKAYRAGTWETYLPTAAAATVVPPPPSDLQATTPVDSRVRLGWTDANSGQSGFRIERCSGSGCLDFAQVGTVAADTRTFMDDPAASGEYTYRIRSYSNGACSWNSDYSPTAVITNSTPPVGGLAVNVLNTSAANLSWTGYNPAATGYTVEKCAGEQCSSFSAAVTVTTDPSALLKLEMNEPAWQGTSGEVTDGSGRGNHGTAYDGAMTAPGMNGQGGSFDGVKAHVVAPADGRELAQWTVEFWLKPAAGGTSGTVFQWADSNLISAAVPFLRLDRTAYVSSGTSYLYWGYTGNFPMKDGPSAQSSAGMEAKDNEWTHVAVTYDGNWLRFYRNGSILYQSEYNLYTPVQQGNARHAYFGAGRDKSTNLPSYFKGLMDSAAIYRRALSDGEVLARYQQPQVTDTTLCSATSYTFRAKAVGSGLSNSGGGCWTKRAPVAVDPFQPNYQVRLDVVFEDGMQADFDDLRFYDEDNRKELPYWLEKKTDGTSATAWFRTGASSRIYLYYGNSSATTASSGKSTFESFDDFRDTNPLWKNTIWADGIYNNSSGNLAESGGTLNFSYKTYNNYTWDTSTTTINEALITGVPQGIDFHAQVKLNSFTIPDQTQAGIALVDRYFSSVYQFGRYRNDATGTDSLRLQRLDGTNVTDSVETALPSYLAVRRTGAAYSFFVSSDNATWTEVWGSYSDFSPLKLALFGRELTNGTTALTFSMDDFYIRKYAVQEPAAAMGTAETLASCQNLAWEAVPGTAVTVATPAPSAPGNLTAQGFDTQVTLTWTDATTTETGFRVERCTGEGCVDFVQVGTAAANAATYTDPGPLELGATYSYRVRATKSTACAWDSEYTPVVTATTGILAPGNLTSTVVGYTQINLSWTDLTRSETGFKIERCQGSGCSDFVQIGTAGLNAVSYSDTAVCAGGSYTYRIRANSGAVWDSPYSNPVSVTATIPPSVNDLAARPLSDSKVELSWTDRTTGETGFAVERCDYAGCSDFRAVVTTVANATRHTDSGLAPGNVYSYRIRAINTTAACPWNSDYSNIANATPAVLPPVGLTATVAGTTRVNLSWTDTNAVEGAYGIERCSGDSCTGFGQLATVGGNVTTYTDDSAVASTSYSYRVRAANPGFSNGGGGCWTKRAKVSFTNFQPNHQTRFVIYYDSEMQTDFDDIRFYDATTGQELPYWVESVSNSSSQYVWLKTGANNNIYMYFGNAMAAATSSGTATFEAFDDFNDGTINPAVWTVLPGNGTVTESGGVLTFSYTGTSANDWNAAGRQGTALQLNSLPAGDIVAGVKFTMSTVNDLTHAGLAVLGSDTGAYLMGRYRSGYTQNYSVMKNDGTGLAAATPYANYLAVARVGGQYSFGAGYYMSDFTAVGSSLSDIPFTGLALFGREWGTATTSNVSFTMDNFYIRKKATVEPSASVSTYNKETATLCGDQWTSEPGNVTSVTTPSPVPPADLRVEAISDNRLRLAWTDNSDETVFRVERCQGSGCADFAEIGTAGANATSFIDSGLPAAGSFSYRVRGYKLTTTTEWYSPYSNQVSATVATAPPVGLTATPIPAGILLSWSGRVPGASGYTIERCSGAECTDYSPIGTAGGEALSYTDSTAASGTAYRYRVRAFSTTVSNSGGACWTTRIPVVIDNFQPAYETKVTVSSDAGMRSDFGDLRFYDLVSGQELPYWIDSVSATSATAWVKPGSANTIYLYYGNPSATSSSNGKNTFLVFDDFSDGTIDSGLWTMLSGSGTLTESGGVLNFSYTGANDNDWNAAARNGVALKLNAVPQGNYVAEVTLNSAKASNLYAVNTKTMAGLGFYESDTNAFLLGRYKDEADSVFKMKNDGTLKTQVYGYGFPMYLKMKKVKGELTTSPPFAGQYQFKAETTRSTFQYSSTGDPALPAETIVLYGREWGTGSSDLSFDLDNFLIRRYLQDTTATSEPAASVNIGSKEAAILCPDIWTGPYSNEATASR